MNNFRRLNIYFFPFIFPRIIGLKVVIQKPLLFCLEYQSLKKKKLKQRFFFGFSLGEEIVLSIRSGLNLKKIKLNRFVKN